MDNNYPANSDRALSQPNQSQTGHDRKVSGVVDGGASLREHGWKDQVRDFFGLDEMKTFRDYVGLLSDVTNRVYGAIDILTGGRNSGDGRYYASNRINYGGQYRQASTNSQNANRQAQGSARQRLDAPVSYRDIEYANRGKAELVKANILDLLQHYTAVSISDIFDLSELTDPNGYNDAKYGWTELSDADIRIVYLGNGKYGLDLPRASQL